MLAHISPVLGFLEEVEKLSRFPEITSLDTAVVRLGQFDMLNRNPIHSNQYDPRLFEAFSNSIRKLIILSKEPISLQNTHDQVKNRLTEDTNDLNNTYEKIQEYLNKNMNEVTQFSFDFPDSIMDRMSVYTLLNNYFAATGQHAKPDAQRIIDEINVLTYGALTEMIRVMMIDLYYFLKRYAELLKTHY